LRLTVWFLRKYGVYVKVKKERKNENLAYLLAISTVQNFDGKELRRDDSL